MSDETLYPADTIYEFTRRCFVAAGIPDDAAQIVTNNLMDAQMRGIDSHGVVRLLTNYIERIESGATNKQPHFTLVQDSPSTALVDADNGLGSAATTYAMQLCLEKARATGAAWVGVRNSNHFGVASFYTNQIAQQGMIGFAFTNAPPAVAPWGGTEPHLGTNPVCFSAPTRSGLPISSDMATTVVAKGYVLLAMAKGEPIPLGWAQDKLGRPTTDARAAVEGTMLPMAQHKGYALALMVDILSGVLTGASFGHLIGSQSSDSRRGQDVGHLIGAIDIAHFLPLEQFYERLDVMVSALKSSPVAEGFEQILVPGEPEEIKRQKRLQDGIPIAEPIRRSFAIMGERLGVPFA